MKQYKTASVFGGTGFVGRHVVSELAKAGYVVKVITRVPERAYFLKPAGAVGQVVPVACTYANQDAIEDVVQGSDFVVNCIGLLYERRKNDFMRNHVDVPAAISKACANTGVERFVHISALGVEESRSKYARSKLEGEQAVLSNFPTATILRPSVIFGENDDFFNKFASIASIMGMLPLPIILPLIGGGKTRFQPVFVGDVADAVMRALTLPLTGELTPQGKTYQLGGPEVVDFKGIYQKLSQYTKHNLTLISLPFCLAKFQAFFMALLPSPLLTPDQVESLKSDSIVEEGTHGFSELYIHPTAMDSVLPSYLERYKKGGRFADVGTV